VYKRQTTSLSTRVASAFAQSLTVVSQRQR
jgi:hypothetical protein